MGAGTRALLVRVGLSLRLRLGLGRGFRRAGSAGENLKAQISLVLGCHHSERLRKLFARADDHLVILVVHPGKLNGSQVGKD
jgi:hypothetical protein